MTFIRSAIAVLTGFIVMMVIVRLTIPAAAIGVGLDRLRDADTGVMTRWFILVVEWPTSLFASVLGGVVAGLIAGRLLRLRAGFALAAFVVITGLALMAVPEAVVQGTPTEAGADSGPIPQLPPRPAWDRLFLPLLGGVGVLLGVRFVERAAIGLGARPESSEAS